MTLRTCVDLSIFDQGKQISQDSLVIDPASLYQAFEKVKDGRGRKGTRYPLAFILTLILLGKMAGETKIEGIIDWINLRKEKIKKLLNWPKRFPSHKTYDYALAKCNHHEVAKAIAQVILAARSVEQCGVVHFMGGYYDIPIKDNHPVVRQDLILFFEDKGIDRSEFQSYKETNKGHGRLETREIWTSTQMNGFFEKDWLGIAQVWMIKRTVKEKGEERIEIVYGMTNLPRKKASASRLLELNRKHWAIENRLLTPS